MAPVVPCECDQCHEPLPSPLLCGRCKGFAYCSVECQSKHWDRHKLGCSLLPAGKLVPKTIEPKANSSLHQAQLYLLARHILDEWSLRGVLVGNLWDQPGPHRQREPTSITSAERLSLLLTPAFIAFINHQLPAEFVISSYPGRTRPDTNDLRHRLVLLSRFLLLHHLTLAPPDWTFRLLCVMHLGDKQDEEYAVMRATGNGLPTDPCKAGARLYGPKVLAVPDQLSAAEYAAMVPWMTMRCAGGGSEDATVWIVLDQVAQQTVYCPELLDYVPG